MTAAAAGLLSVGDEVIWRHSWGTAIPASARVTGILVCSAPGSKYGEEVKAVAWARVESHERAVIVDLDSGNWAWGFQVRPWAEGG